jgi:hypothetical protein
MYSMPAHGEAYSIQYYVIKFVSDLRQWFSPSIPVSSTNKTDRHDIAEILLKVTLNTITPKHAFHAILDIYMYYVNYRIYVS